MAYNNSTQSEDAPFSIRKSNSRIIGVQVLIAFFLYLNCLLLTSFLKKEVFRRSMRYILFAYTLISDCVYLLVTNVLLLLAFFNIFMQIWFCILLLIVASAYTLVFLVTLTVMSLERYVAICMPLQHGALCTTRNTLHCILILNTISSIPISISLSIYLASVPLSTYMEDSICSMEMLIVHRWQSHYWSAVTQLYFVIMLVVIVFCYVQIMKAARKASGETKKSSGKGMKTVLLHGFQLILCLARLWCPFVEYAIIEYDMGVYADVRYANYILFALAPRCLSSLVYGLWDRRLLLMLKYFAVFGLCYKSPPVLAD